MIDPGGDEEQERARARCGAFKLLTALRLSISVNVLLTFPIKFPFVFEVFYCSPSAQLSIQRYTSQTPKFPEAILESRLFKPQTALPGVSPHCQFLLSVVVPKAECLEL